MTGLDCGTRYGILDAECELIAAILDDNRAYHAVRHLLQPDHFLSPSHRHQFTVIARTIELGEVADHHLLGLARHPLAGLRLIDPLDYALMIYGSHLGREAVGTATLGCGT